ncbi:metal-dependent hydrolase [Asaia astilbis]|uniref:metal-dependent hydrolase n=1 Tax=Asaia astilbis TaxID=610244 RepID=UPI00046EBA97|nr:metal-dependent hydrolase [Asaia astilbis]
MIGRSHIVLGVACAVTASSMGYVPLSLASLIAAGFGSLTPDLDTERSMLGCRARWLSRPLSRLCGHRTVTHSLLIPLLASGLTLHYAGVAALRSAWGAFLIGYASHILADLVTGGCWALYPLARGRIAFWPYAKTGSFGEYVVLVFCLGLLSCVTYHYLSQDLIHPVSRLHRPGLIA